MNCSLQANDILRVHYCHNLATNNTVVNTNSSRIMARRRIQANEAGKLHVGLNNSHILLSVAVVGDDEYRLNHIKNQSFDALNVILELSWHDCLMELLIWRCLDIIFESVLSHNFDFVYIQRHFSNSFSFHFTSCFAIDTIDQRPPTPHDGPSF